MEDRHHLYWPRKSYQTALERKFRNLPCHMIWLPREQHNTIHAIMQPPAKPDHNRMTAAIQRHNRRECGCQ